VKPTWYWLHYIPEYTTQNYIFLLQLGIRAIQPITQSMPQSIDLSSSTLNGPVATHIHTTAS